MDTKRKKELLQQWKNRHPEMGVISFRCKKIQKLILTATALSYQEGCIQTKGLLNFGISLERKDLNFLL